jgi:sigma-E factor negative regulatory protein RseC
MDEIGIVKSLHGNVAMVSVERKSACDQCRAGCSLTESGAEMEALNEAGAKVGQRVRVTVKPFTYLKSSIFVYGIPALMLILGAIIGKEMLPHIFLNHDPDTLSAISGFGALLISLVVVKIWSMHAEKKTEYKPVIEEIIEIDAEEMIHP